MPDQPKLPPDPAAGPVISMAQAARLLMISQARVRQLAVEGYVERFGHGRVGLVAAVQGYCRYLREAAERRGKTAAETRLRKERAREIEMRVEARRETLIAIEDAVTALTIVAETAQAELGKVPDRCGGGPGSEIRPALETAVSSAQAQIADALHIASQLARHGGELPHGGA